MSDLYTSLAQQSQQEQIILAGIKIIGDRKVETWFKESADSFRFSWKVNTATRLAQYFTVDQGLINKLRNRNFY